MVNNVLQVMFFDRDQQGARRLIRNTASLESAISTCNGLKVKVDGVSRLKTVASEAGAEDLLMREGGPVYHALIVHGLALGQESVMTTAILVNEEIGRPNNRTIYLHVGEKPVDYVQTGVTFIQFHSGDGYLTQVEAKQIAKVLEGIAKEEFS